MIRKIKHQRWQRQALELYCFADSLPLCARLLDAGASIIQLRAKKLADSEFLRLALDMQQLIREHPADAVFIINDRVDIAFEIKADGVHIGQNDMNFQEVLQAAPEGMAVGVSVHDAGQAIRAERAGAAYVGAGAVFATPTKPDAVVIGLEELRRISTSISIPVVAIGGIGLDNISRVKEHGADYFAVISEINEADDIALRISEFKNMINS